MSISTTYKTFILENIILNLLKDGEVLTLNRIANEYDTYVETYDITKPIFDNETYKVAAKDISSKTLFNNCNKAIRQDLAVTYRHLLKISEQAINNFERWRTEATLLETRLNKLHERITSLLIVSEDTAGYLNYIQDSISDASKTDLTNTTAYVNMNKGYVCIGTNNIGATRVDLSNLRNENIEFTVLTKTNLVSNVILHNTQKKYIISDINNYWQHRVYTNKPGPVTAEIKIDLLNTKLISRIDVDLHMANQNSSVQITPFYSLDNYSWKQLPITNPTRSIIDKITFQFSSISAKWIKFILTKTGYDQVSNEMYTYEFGADEISFYNEGFESDTEVVFISTPLFVTNPDGNLQEFSRVVLEVCEHVPSDTSINYFIAVSNSSSMDADGFVEIDPINRDEAIFPTILDFGDLDAVEINDIGISYDIDGATNFVNPDQNYTMITAISGTTATEAAGVASALRYAFFNSRDRILDYQIASDIEIAAGTLELWRNVSTQNDETKVRDYVNGWGFNEPFYYTTVYVSNPDGYNIDFGDKFVVLDGEKKSGKIVFTYGNHTLLIHKDNWVALDSSVSIIDLASLKSADSLYPYNHRYLVEGYSYAADWSTSEEKIYTGFDIVAEYLMSEISVFDMINNTIDTNYSKFARDKDALDTGRTLDSFITDTNPSTVFLVKSNENNSDFLNEKFTLKFKIPNSLFTYLRFKAVLKTEDSNITPILDSYRIKLSS